MTRRTEIMAQLESNPQTIEDLAYTLEVSKQDVANDLEHVFKSLKRQNKRLLIRPAQCLKEECEFVFSTKRKKMSDPGRCPQCRSERISPQLFKIV